MMSFSSCSDFFRGCGPCFSHVVVFRLTEFLYPTFTRCPPAPDFNSIVTRYFVLPFRVRTVTVTTKRTTTTGRRGGGGGGAEGGGSGGGRGVHGLPITRKCRSTFFDLC